MSTRKTATLPGLQLLLARPQGSTRVPEQAFRERLRRQDSRFLLRWRSLLLTISVQPAVNGIHDPVHGIKGLSP